MISPNKCDLFGLKEFLDVVLVNYLSPETVSTRFFIDNGFDRLYVILAFVGASNGVYLLSHDNKCYLLT